MTPTKKRKREKVTASPVIAAAVDAVVQSELTGPGC